VNRQDGELDHVALRESAFFILAGAQLFASDTMCLPCSLKGAHEERQGSRGWILAAFVVWVASYAYLGLAC